MKACDQILKQLSAPGVGWKLSVYPLLALLLCLFIPLSSASLSGSTGFDEGTSNPVIQRVRQIYTSQIGIREKGYNAGKQIEAYLRYAGLPKGNPWCAAFVCWVYGEAGVENPKTGWSPGLFPGSRIVWSREGRSSKVIKSCRLPVVSCRHHAGNFRAVSTTQALQNFHTKLLDWEFQALFDYPREILRRQIYSDLNPDRSLSCRQPATDNRQPRPGDIFGLYFPEKRRIAHAGFVDQWDGTWLITVEGNTNDSGSREGDGVYRKRRLVSSIYRVARYIPDGKEGT